MRIAIFTEIYQRGGVDTFVTTLLNAWPRQEDAFVLVSNADHPGIDGMRRRLTARCEFLSYEPGLNPERAALGGLRNSVRRVVSPVGRYVRLAALTRQLGSVWAKVGADALLVVNGGYPGGDACRAAALAWVTAPGRAKSIHSFHNRAGEIPWYLWLQENAVDRLLVRATRAFVTVSDSTAVSMAVRPAIARAGLTSYIYNGIASDPGSAGGDLRLELGVGRDSPLCLMLGTYELRKGHRFLFEAFRRVLDAVPNAHLVVCGFGLPHDLERVRAEAKAFRLGRQVHLLGFLPDTGRLFAAAEVVVIASQDYESFGLVAVEAMAHRVPVVSTDVGGLREVIVDGQGGYCVGSNDVEAYADRVVSLLKDKALNASQGEAGFRRYASCFRAERMARQYADLMVASQEPDPKGVVD